MKLEWLKSVIGDSYTDAMDEAAAKELGKLFVSKEDFNKVNDTKKTLDDQLKTHADEIKKRDDQLTELKKLDATALQGKIAELETANKTATEKAAADLKAAQLSYKLENRLIKEGAVNVKAVTTLLDMTKVSLDGDNLLGVDDQLKALREKEKWAFGTQQQQSGGMEQGAGGATGTVDDEIKSLLFTGTK